MNKCYICDCEEDLRPYGEDGQPVCFNCAMGTPEQEAITMEQYKRRLMGIAGLGASVIIINGEQGPRIMTDADDPTQYEVVAEVTIKT